MNLNLNLQRFSSLAITVITFLSFSGSYKNWSLKTFDTTKDKEVTRWLHVPNYLGWRWGCRIHFSLTISASHWIIVGKQWSKPHRVPHARLYWFPTLTYSCIVCSKKMPQDNSVVKNVSSPWWEVNSISISPVRKKKRGARHATH